MDRVRDQTTNMRQLLTTVAMGLHRNVTALEKLKTQTKQVEYSRVTHRSLRHVPDEKPCGLLFGSAVRTTL